MNTKALTGLLTILLLSISAFAQQNDAGNSSAGRPRVVVDESVTQPTPTPERRVVVIDNTPNPGPTPYRAENQAETNASASASNQTYRMSYGQIKSKIEEAKRQMNARPIPTSMTESFVLTDIVRLAFYDWESKEIDYVVLTKKSFLKTGERTETISTAGKRISVYTIRGNGVNTPVTITGENEKPFLPLLVQYPREDGGVLQNIAFYVSTHPGIVTPEVVNAGKLYVRNTIDIAREKLREKRLFVNPQVTDMAERLAVVEHVDHWRFRNEYHPIIYNDVYTLFALNEGDTYKYSVSSAGAGGMVQMIPATYRMMRTRYPQVGLMPDFVEGMRDHVNASQAMLLYMQMTWNDLISNTTVYEAIQSGIATPEELMSAGYNSNPARLPGYIRRGGPAWKNLIPRETQIYLEINESFEKHVPLNKRTR